MRLIILVVTPDLTLERLISQRKEALIPIDYRRDVNRLFGASNVGISCFRGDLRESHCLTNHVRDILKSDVVGIMILVDQRIKEIVRELGHVCFIASYPETSEIKSPSNFFGALLGPLLRDFRALSNRFEDHKYRKMFTLPLRNFIAHELDNLQEVCRTSVCVQGYAERLDAALKALRCLQRPKRYEDSNQVYLVDRSGKCFQLGHERHARADTAIPPHNIICILSNEFRFGRRFDSGLHYNVTMERDGIRMEKNYANCHNELKSGESRTHLNMFPNDYF